MTPTPDSAERTWMLATLKALAEVGMELATDLRDEVRQAGGSAGAEAALRYSRISRAVRQSVALYGLVLEDKLAEAAGGRQGRSAASPSTPKPLSEKDQRMASETRDTAIRCVSLFIDNIAPRETLDAFMDELHEWRSDLSFDRLYAHPDHMSVAAEAFLMLGLTVPKGLNYHDQFQRLVDDHAAGKDQPWRQAWEFLQGRDRPHVQLSQGYRSPRVQATLNRSPEGP